MKTKKSEVSLKPYPERDLTSYLLDASARCPSHPALIHKSEVLSYRDLTTLSDIFAAFLSLSHNFEVGDVVAISLPNITEFIISEIGAWKAGAIVAPFNPNYSVERARRFMNDLKPSVLVTTHPNYQQFVRAGNLKTKIIVLCVVEEPPIHDIDISQANSLEKNKNRELFWFSDIIHEYKTSPPPDHKIALDSPAIILAGSGTTGRNKLIVGSHRAFIFTSLQILEWIKAAVHEWAEKIMLCVPLFHAYGNVAVQASTFVSHNTLCLTSDLRNTGEIIHTINTIKPSILAAVPVIFARIANSLNTEKDLGLNSIKVSFSGGSALPPYLKNTIEIKTGGKVIEGYSLTEAMMASIMTPLFYNSKQGSVGLPLADVEIKIVDVPKLAAKDANVGEIAVKAPQLMMKYWNDDFETSNVFISDEVGNKWLLTGDLGMIDKDGFLFVLERKKDLIEIGKFVIFPSEIEHVLLQHPSIVQAGVTGMSSGTSAKFIQAWIVLRNGADVDKADIIRYCNQRLPVHKVPRTVSVCSSLPTSIMGKVIRSLLRTDIQDQSTFIL